MWKVPRRQRISKFEFKRSQCVEVKSMRYAMQEVGKLSQVPHCTTSILQREAEEVECAQS